MSYTKTNWSKGDIITAAKLNHAEQGIYDATEAAASAGGGADIVFQIVYDTTSSVDYSIISGSLDDVVAKVADGGIPVAELYRYDDGGYWQMPYNGFIPITDGDDSELAGAAFYFIGNNVIDNTTNVEIITKAAEIRLDSDGTINTVTSYVSETSCSLAPYAG